MANRSEIEVTFGKLAALEYVVEELLPILIAASPNRREAEELLESWAARETSVLEEIELGDLADSMLKLLRSAG